MVQLLLLDSSPQPSPLALSAQPSDSINHIRSRIASAHPAAPSLDEIRLVRGGRILLDSQTLSDVLGSSLLEQQEPHTIHLVLKPRTGPAAPPAQQKSATPLAPSPVVNLSQAAASTSSFSVSSSSSITQPTAGQRQPTAGPSTVLPPPPLSAPPAVTTPPPPATTTAATGVSAFSTSTVFPDMLALTDALGLYSYLSRSSLCTLLDLPVATWEHALEGIPVVSEAEARVTVNRTMQAWGIPSGLGTGDWGELGEWISEEGAEWQIEVDGLPYHLAIPPLSTLSPIQKEALHSYLIYSSRIDLIHDAGALYEALLSATPAVTATAARSRIILLDMRRAMLVAPGMVFSALKYAFVWYIFAVREGPLERFLWALGLYLWWMWEGIREYRRLRPPLPALPTPTPAAAAAGRTRAASSAAAAGADGENGEDAATAPPPPVVLPTFPLPPSPSPLHRLGLLRLAHENDLLRLSEPATVVIPGEDNHSSSSSSSPPDDTPSWLARLFLPPMLLVLSLIPAFEAHRSLAIRQREAVMRETVELLVPPPPAPAPVTTLSDTTATSTTAHDLASSSHASSANTSSTEPPRPSSPVFPPNLGPNAKAYYVRVIERGEQIDWAEEEQAQRALLAAEERDRRARGAAAAGENRHGEDGGGFF